MSEQIEQTIPDESKKSVSNQLNQSNQDELKKLDQRRATTSNKTAEQLKQLLLAKQLALEEHHPNSDRFYSLKEVQLLLGGKSRSTIYRWEKNGTIPASHKIGPNSVGFLKSEMDEWFSKFQGVA
jgi:prophage regulatory protein